MTKLVCIVGSDEFNDRLISKVPEANNWSMLPVLDRSDVQPGHGMIDFDDLYGRATEVIENAGRPPDAIVGHLDFPVTALVSLLCRDFGLNGASPEAVARCEHKFWMRRFQHELWPESTPAFRDAEAPLPCPFWLKPVKAHSSILGAEVRNRKTYQEALHRLRRAMHYYGEPFNAFLRRLDPEANLPGDVDGDDAIAEELISAAEQFTIEGYVHNGEAVVYGVIETRRADRHSSTLSSYHYPADLSEETVQKARDITHSLLQRMDFDQGPFNAEFFREPDSGTLRLLEINPRLSKSHAPLFHLVNGCTHHRQVIELALGNRPSLPAHEGTCKKAAKFMVRSHEVDGLVNRVPTEEEIARLSDLIPGLMVQVLTREGDRLSELGDQDSFSFELMDIFIGGDAGEFIEDAYRRCRDSLPILIQPMPGRHAS